MLGWTIVTHLPPNNKYVIIAAPHTSLWDYPLTFLYALSINIHGRWVGHRALFVWPFGHISRKLGGIEPEQRNEEGFVKQLIREFDSHDRFILGLAPEGTKAFVPRWRTGFYHIALGAKVPIVFAFVDYKSKSLGCGHYFMPSGDADQDGKVIHSFYRNIEGKNPNHAGPIKL